jgi:hypothetical protein
MFIRPNWRNPECYKEMLDPGYWNWIAWGFLRRNPEYQRDYEAYYADFGDKQIDDDPERFGYWCAFAEDKWQINRFISVNPLTSVNGDEFDEFSGDDFIDLPFDQRDSFKRVGFNNTIEGPLVLIPVDLSKPLKDLEAGFKRTVQRLREEGIKQGTVIPRTNRVLAFRIYVEQLRILDAFAAGATVQEIGEFLSPGAANEPDSRQRNKRINAAHKAALKMQDGGYRVLI